VNPLEALPTVAALLPDFRAPLPAGFRSVMAHHLRRTGLSRPARADLTRPPPARPAGADEQRPGTL